MNSSAKSNALQSYQAILYNRALHPELFSLKSRDVIRQGDWELEAWVMEGAHVLRFEFGDHRSCELVTAQEDNLPASGVVSAYLCAGERDFEHRFKGDRVTYFNSVQTETLSENLYLGTLGEMTQHVAEHQTMSHRWQSDAGESLSMLDIQKYAKEVHVQAYHLLAAGGIVIRTQTIFEHA